MSSVLAFIILVLYFDSFILKTKIVIGFLGSVGSIFFLFILNTLQFGLAFMATIFLDLVKNNKIKFLLICLSITCLSIFIFKPILIWKLLYFLKITDHSAVDLDSTIIMGFNRSTLIKPFYAIFQMIFGLHIAPTNSIFVMGLFLFLSIIFSIIFYRSFKVEKMIFFRSLLFVIIPFFMIYYFFQTLSLPGATQLESKHGMLILPFLLYLTIKSYHYLSPIIHATFSIGILSAQLIGMVKTFDKKQTDWNKIAFQSHSVLSGNNNSAILMDGRSSEIYNFYSQDLLKDYPIYYTWQNIDSLKSILSDKSQLILLLNDYKSYENLSIKQNWNAGVSSESRFNTLNNLLDHFNYHYSIKDSYIMYPTFYYFLEKKEFPNNSRSFSVWEHHLKDLELPLEIGNSTVLSSVLISQDETISMRNDSSIILNLENGYDSISLGDTVGFIKTDHNNIHLIYGDNCWSLFSSYLDIEPSKKFITYSWKHNPLISGSINYTGSYFAHEMNLFKIEINGVSKKLEISNLSNFSKIRIWVKQL